MSDIKLSLDGAEENDPKLEAITNDSPDLIENKIIFSEAEEKMIDEFSKKNLPRKYKYHLAIRLRSPKENPKLFRKKP